jgi:hypothetical protein
MRVARAGYARMRQKRPELYAKIRVVYCDFSEFGAIHSERRYVNPIIKKYEHTPFEIKGVPWILMFQGGECRVSKMMSGFCDRLRDYPEISLPPVLLFDPLKFQIDSDGGHMEGRVDDLIDTQRTLKQMRRVFDLALSFQEAQRLAANSNPPYGILLVSARVPGDQVRAIADKLRKRIREVVVVVMHRPKREAPDAELLKLSDYVRKEEERVRKDMREQRRNELGLTDADEDVWLPRSPGWYNTHVIPSLNAHPTPDADVQVTATRPLRKSFLDTALKKFECTYQKYDEVGLSASTIIGSRVKTTQHYQVDGDEAEAYSNFIELVETSIGNLAR